MAVDTRDLTAYERASLLISLLPNHTELVLRWSGGRRTRCMARDMSLPGRRLTNLDAGSELWSDPESLERMEVTSVEVSSLSLVIA